MKSLKIDALASQVLRLVRSDGTSVDFATVYKHLTLAQIPGVGVAMLSYSGTVDVWVPASVAAMCNMAPIRIAWMVSAYRGILRCYRDRGIFL